MCNSPLTLGASDATAHKNALVYLDILDRLCAPHDKKHPGRFPRALMRKINAQARKEFKALKV